MNTPWSELYKELEEHEAENPKEKVRKDPYNPKSKLISKAEKIYWKARMKHWELIEERRKYKTYEAIVYKQRKQKGSKAQKIYNSKAKYTFMQYNWVINRWAREMLGVSQEELDLLLYVYPVGFFAKQDLQMLWEAMGHPGTVYYKLRKFRDNKMVETWRKRHKDEEGVWVPTLYCLTNYTQIILTRMHKMALGEERIPEGWNNPLFHGKDNKFKAIFKRMNKRVENE